MSDAHVPSQAEMWRFLVDFKDVVVASFDRVGRQMAGLEERLNQRMSSVEERLTGVEGSLSALEERLSRRITRVDDRLSELQTVVARSFGHY